MTNQKKQSTEAAVREIRRRSRRKFSPEEKIRIVLEGLRGEQSVREATSDEVKDLRSENRELKEVVAEITLKKRVLKKSLTGHGEEDAT